MSKILLKSRHRKTQVSRADIRNAVAGSFSKGTYVKGGLGSVKKGTKKKSTGKSATRKSHSSAAA